MPPEAVVSNALKYGCRSIAYTYSEPIIFYEYTHDTSLLAKDQGLFNILVTAGYIEQEPLKELCRVTHAANVNLKGITEDYYRDMCSGTLKTRPGLHHHHEKTGRLGRGHQSPHPDVE